MNSFTVIVEGNIASGKSTLLNYFSKFPDIQTINEPVDKWRNCNGFNLLDLMYKDYKQWLFPFQSYATLTMLQNHTEKCDHEIKLMERSFYSSKNIFIEASKTLGKIHTSVHHMVAEWFEFIERNVAIRIDLIVYLRCSPEVVYERMRKRCREEEDEVSSEYLKILHDLHEEWLINKMEKTQIPIIVIDANQENLSKVYDKLMNHILKMK